MKIRSIIILLTMLTLGMSLEAQESKESSIKNLFLDQLSAFPQEKIYVQTDKSEYTSGEIIWFRVHLVDAAFLKQANASRYVYVELIDPTNNLVERIKLRPDSTGCFYGNIKIKEDIAEGNYILRGYTWFMQNIGEDYFFNKSIYISNPISENISVNIKYFDVRNTINAEIQFFSNKINDKIIPEKCAIFYGNKNSINEKDVSFKEKIGHCSFSENEISLGRVFQLQASINNKVYKKYFKIPHLKKSFDVSFFPEGGYAPISTNVAIAFKAINNSGLSEEIRGQVFDDRNNLCTDFNSTHLGMGVFNMYYSPGVKYYAICTNKENISKRFNLPEPSDSAVSLRTAWERDRLYIKIIKSPGYVLQHQIRLIAHIRGIPIYDEPWDTKKEYLIFKKKFFPAGIIHFLLIDRNRNILSERLVFSSQSSTFAKTNIEFDKQTYIPRDNINMSIRVTDEKDVPLPGNISLAVTDSEYANIDTTSNIISTLLLSSELKGYIEDPMSYLQKDNKKSAAALDVLLMTQGWRRYDIPNLLKGKITKDLKYPVELSEEVKGKAEGIFSSLKKGNISLLAIKDSIIGYSFTQPDNKGNFIFKNLEYEEGTNYLIQANTKDKSKKIFLDVDTMRHFPLLTTIPIIEQERFALKNNYLSNDNKKHIVDDKVYKLLGEVTVTAKRESSTMTDSPYYSIMSSMVISAKDIENWHLLTVYDLLRRIPGVTVSGSEVKYRGNTPMLILDNIPTDGFDYDMLSVDDVKDAFVSPGTSIGAIFGSRGANGAIIINTKKGFVQTNKISSNIKYIKALGYQQHVQFYSPIYDTDQKRNNGKPDYRTTIYWNPNVQIGTNGIANLNFYAADTPSKYVVLIEGVSMYGHLIHQEEEISIMPNVKDK